MATLSIRGHHPFSARSADVSALRGKSAARGCWTPVPSRDTWQGFPAPLGAPVGRHPSQPEPRLPHRRRLALRHDHPRSYLASWYSGRPHSVRSVEAGYSLLTPQHGSGTRIEEELSGSQSSTAAPSRGDPFESGPFTIVVPSKMPNSSSSDARISGGIPSRSPSIRAKLYRRPSWGW